MRPDNAWAIEEYELRAGPPEGLPTVRQVRVEYGAEQDGVPALDRVISNFQGKDGQTYQTTTKVRTLEFVPVPEEEFELRAFGLKPPRKETVRHKSVWHRILRATAWTLTAVVLTLLLTVTMHFSVRRPTIPGRQRDVPPTNDAERSP